MKTKTNKRYIHVRTIDNKNVGVIKIELPVNLIEKKAESVIRQEIEKKLPKLISEEYNCPVKIRDANFGGLIPIEVDFTVVVEGEDEDHQLTVTLSETRIY